MTQGTQSSVGLRDPAVIEAAAAELLGFQKILESHGVTVRRPRRDPNMGFRTPWFESQTSNGASCPRDVITVVGNELIEAATPWRSRNFEIFQYRELLMEYYRRDPEMIWSAVPFPSLRDATFREGYEHTAGQRAEQMQKKEFVTHDWVEPTFDAADIIRCGKDVFVLHGHTCNLAGFEWIKRQLGRRGLRAHLLHMPNVLNPSHIDASVMPLRPGLLLAAPPVIEDLGVFKENGWEVVPCVEPEDWMSADPNYKGKSGRWIAMNVLSLSPDKVCVMQHDEPMRRQLEGLGLTVVPVPFKSVVEFGGALHCATMDIRREGGCESYFPKIDEDESS
eukprot:TRINITY_DN781_c0_g1_i12.p1 TRINITY_DN781_c0_g1~~TRINITY_DN781_c0_g1_i12.p1  ORF type:complete len:335 (-),score=87.59 TRINITY_DN781_c0_g1_i12:221-1225(-)